MSSGVTGRVSLALSDADMETVSVSVTSPSKASSDQVSPSWSGAARRRSYAIATP